MYDTNMPGSNRFRLYHTLTPTSSRLIGVTEDAGQSSAVNAEVDRKPNIENQGIDSANTAKTASRAADKSKTNDIVVNRNTIRLCFICKK